VVLIDSIGFGIIIPVMPQLILGLAEVSLSQASRIGGYLMFTYAIVQFFAAPILGNLGDRFGRRPILLFSLAALGLDYLLMGVAPTLIWLFVARLISGAASSTFSIAYAYVTDITPEEKRAQRFGMVGAAFGGGFVLGPVIGGFLGEFGDRIPFFAAAGLALLNVVYGYFVLGESLAKENRRPFELHRANPVGAVMQLKKYPVVMGLACAYFLYMLGHVSLPSTWTYYTIEKFSWSESQIGLSLGFAGVFIILVQAVLIRWAIPAMGAFKAGIVGMLAVIIGFCGYAFSSQGWQMYPWLAVAAISGFVTPAFQAIMTSQIPANAQGELQGALSSLTSLTSIIGPLVMTQLFAIFTGPSAPFYFPGVSFFAAAVMTVICLFIFIPVVKMHQLTSLGKA
jgi:DHA1 family tetracycline resistance protein-like MFS transporter